MNTTQIEEMKGTQDRLRKASRAVRMHALEMVHHSRLGHPGGDLSCADVLVTLYLAVMRIDPKNPQWPDRDRFIMSKGHCSAALDRKSTRLNSSHLGHLVCRLLLEKKKNT